MSKDIITVGFIDCETTGLYPQYDDIIELSIVLTRVSKKEGKVLEILEEYNELNEPTKKISKKITSLTGITQDMVIGKRLDINKIKELLSSSDILIAHNASFDRSFLMKYVPECGTHRWFCSVRNIAWKAYGFENGKLQHLLEKNKIEVTTAHRALDDIHGLIKLLSITSSDKTTYLFKLLKTRAMSKRYVETETTIKEVAIATEVEKPIEVPKYESEEITLVEPSIESPIKIEPKNLQTVPLVDAEPVSKQDVILTEQIKIDRNYCSKCNSDLKLKSPWVKRLFLTAWVFFALSIFFSWFINLATFFFILTPIGFFLKKSPYCKKCKSFI